MDGRITAEALARMRAEVGVEKPLSPAWYSAVTQDAVWHYALGLGDDNPLWWDREYAEKSPAGRMFAPPSFLYAFTHEVTPPGQDAPSGDAEWLPGVAGLWSGDKWVWHSKLFVGEEVHVTRRLEGVEERESRSLGPAVLQTDGMTFRGSDDRLVAELRRTVMRFERASARAHGAYTDLPPATYSPEQRQAIIDHYASESALRRGQVDRYWEDVEVGETLPVLVKGPLTLTSMIGWLMGSGASQTPTNRMMWAFFDQHPDARLLDEESGIDDTLEGGHWEEVFARRSGLPRGYDFGGQRIAFASHVVTDWCGDSGELLELDARLRKPTFLGDTTWFSGKVVDKAEVETRGTTSAQVTCAITGTNQRAEITTTAVATVALPTRS